MTFRRGALALAVPLAVSGCQEGSGEANGEVRLEVEGFQPNSGLDTKWEPEPDYYGTVRNTETGKTFGKVPVGTYTLTVSQSGKTGTATVKVSENETSNVSIPLR
jgi:hypothetical protein